MPQPHSDGKFHKGKGGYSARCSTLSWCFCATGWGFWEMAAPHWATTSCLRRASSQHREERQWAERQMASSVTPYGMPLIVAQRRPFTPTSGGKDWGSRLQERRECADVVNKIRPRAACKAALKGKWRDTTMHLIFPQSPGATEIQRGTGCSTAFFFFFFCPTSMLLVLWQHHPGFSPDKCRSPFSSLWFRESWCVPSTTTGRSHNRSWTNHSTFRLWATLTGRWRNTSQSNWILNY